jgi:ElaB/YqjD/DUF883 family membrane-anchored ribosome-binding protein
MTTAKTPGADTMDGRMDHLKDSVREFVHTGQDKVSDIADKAKELSGQARDTGVRALGRTREMIQLHPIASVAVAFGIGYVAMRVARLF